jgi:hypothetical protein
MLSFTANKGMLGYVWRYYYKTRMLSNFSANQNQLATSHNVQPETSVITPKTTPLSKCKEKGGMVLIRLFPECLTIATKYAH